MSDLPEGGKIILIIIASILAFVLIFKLVSRIQAFSIQLRYVKCEIERNEGEERERWEDEKKHLWRSFFLPFI